MQNKEELIAAVDRAVEALEMVRRYLVEDTGLSGSELGSADSRQSVDWSASGAEGGEVLVYSSTKKMDTAARIAIQRCREWLYRDVAALTVDVNLLLLTGQEEDKRHEQAPLDAESYYLVSPEGAIGFTRSDGREVDWLFLPVGVKSDSLPVSLKTELPEADGKPEAEPDSEAEAEAKPDSAAETEAEPGSEAEAEAAPGSEAEAEAEPGSEAEAEAEPGFEAAAEAEPGSEAETDAEPGSEAEAEAEPGSEAEAEAEPGFEAETEAEPGSEAETEAEPGSEAEAEAEPETEEEAAQDSAPETEAAQSEDAGFAPVPVLDFEAVKELEGELSTEKTEDKPEAEPEPRNVLPRFCRSCGAQLKDTARFCSRCGRKIAE
ncbi:MAG: zinc-ribbon domain-containing protein [Oscillospiraceae bacterium]|nr:zinc-ribbon domain-containing protein [Oscillospiraceae bacterium]